MTKDVIRRYIERVERQWFEASLRREAVGSAPLQTETREQAVARIAVESSERSLGVLYEALAK